jgi:hypothetical protein
MRDALKIGRRACDAAMEASDKMESLFSAIERIADDMADAHTQADAQTLSGLAGIGRAIATELSTRMDHDETALMRLDRPPEESPGAN